MSGEKSRQRVDWDALEPHYRAGIRSLADIGAEFKVSDAAIIKHARKQEWTRNLLAKIKAKADAKVSAAMVSAEVSAKARITEKLTVEVEAQVQARVRLSQRTDISRSRTLCIALLAELETQTGQLPEFENLGEILRSPDDRGTDKLNDIYRAALSLPERTKTMKALAESLRILVAMEREAFSIGDQADSLSLDDRLAALAESAAVAHAAIPRHG